MIANNFNYAISEENGNHTIILLKLATGESKQFNLINKSTAGITSHMESLSDECCEGFFPKPKEAKKKK